MTSAWNSSSPIDPRPVLTPEGRKLLESRSRVLLESLMTFTRPRRGEAIDERTSAVYEQILDEFVELSRAIHSSTSIESIPDDPKLVELGDDVVISSGVGRIERCLIVHPLEATADAGRVSSESPLGAALMGRSVGDRVEFEGRVITILEASRRELRP
ncbi:MAG: GreA/GreB family elongation factor [Actinomycetota bacterium]